jgi:sperm-associated antigen 16 protein
VLERVEISDDEDDDFEYGAVDESGFADDDEDDDDDEEDLASALASVQMSPEKTMASGNDGPKVRAVTQVRPSVVDDFIRNFLIKTNMQRSLDTFNTEWYELESKVCERNTF